MVKKLLCTLFLIFFSTAVFAQRDQDALDKALLENSLIGIQDIVASPNPFSVTTRIRFQADEAMEVGFFVKDLLGNIIHSEKVKAKKGANSIIFYRDELESGIYIYSLKSKSVVISKRLVIK